MYYSQLACLLDVEEKAHYAYHIMPHADVRDIPLTRTCGPWGGQHPLGTPALREDFSGGVTLKTDTEALLCRY